MSVKKPAPKRTRTPKAPRAEGGDPLLKKLRTVCLALPGSVETLTYGHPTFKANGKAYAVLDNYKGVRCVWFRCAKSNRAILLKDARFFPSPYDKAQQALCRAAQDIDWRQLRDLIRASFESVMGS